MEVHEQTQLSDLDTVGHFQPPPVRTGPVDSRTPQTDKLAVPDLATGDVLGQDPDCRAGRREPAVDDRQRCRPDNQDRVRRPCSRLTGLSGGPAAKLDAFQSQASGCFYQRRVTRSAAVVVQGDLWTPPGRRTDCDGLFSQVDRATLIWPVTAHFDNRSVLCCGNRVCQLREMSLSTSIHAKHGKRLNGCDRRLADPVNTLRRPRCHDRLLTKANNQHHSGQYRHRRHCHRGPTIVVDPAPKRPPPRERTASRATRMAGTLSRLEAGNDRLARAGEPFHPQEFFT